MKIHLAFLLCVVVTAEKFKLIQDEFQMYYKEVEECEENEDFNICGSTCFPTCFLDYYPQPCVRMCISGCYCKTGFVQARNGSCVRPTDCPRETVNTTIHRNCFDDPEKGSCTADIPMWYYDQETGFCRRFYYGGCGGNGNRYPSEEKCLQQCREEFFQMKQCGENAFYNGCGTPCPVTCENYENPPTHCVMMCNTLCQCHDGYVQKGDDSCVLPQDCPKKVEEKNCIDPPDVGPCRDIVSRWFYKPQTGKCHEFLYTGCGGNGNNYLTEEECVQNCIAGEN